MNMKLAVAIIDDDQTYLALSKDMLESVGHSVDTYTCPDDFLDVFTKAPEKYNLLLIDWCMPQNGGRLVETIIKINPKQPFLITSGLFTKEFERLPVCVMKGTKATVEEKVSNIMEKYAEVRDDPLHTICQVTLMAVKSSVAKAEPKKKIK